MPNKARAEPKLCERMGFSGPCLQKQDLVALIYFVAGCATVQTWVPCQKEERNPKIVCFLQPVIFLVNNVSLEWSTNQKAVSEFLKIEGASFLILHVRGNRTLFPSFSCWIFKGCIKEILCAQLAISKIKLFWEFQISAFGAWIKKRNLVSMANRSISQATRMHLFKLFCIRNFAGTLQQCHLGYLRPCRAQSCHGSFSFIRLTLRQDQGDETVKILQFLIKKLCKYMNSHMMNKVTRHERVYVYTTCTVIKRVI